MNNEERAKELRYYLADHLNAGIQMQEIERQYDTAEARGRKETIALRNTTVAKVERRETIKDCIAALRASFYDETMMVKFHSDLERAYAILRALLDDTPAGDESPTHEHR